MSVLKNINAIFSIYGKCSPSPATFEELEQLKNFSSIELPKDYEDFVLEGTEIEMKIKSAVHNGYIRFWNVKGCFSMNEGYKIQDWLLPKSLAIADNGGCGILLYMDGADGFGIYFSRLSNLDIEETVKISSSISELLIHAVGVDRLLELEL